MRSFTLSKLRQRRIWGRIVKERLTEPLHLNLWSLFVALFGSLPAKIEHDLILRQHNAYSILRCAQYAKSVGLKTVSLIEFGVASGAGLLNMAQISHKVTRSTGVSFKIYGFDTGAGMPPACDYRDHPDLYQAGDFPMDVAQLESTLPGNARLILGDVSTTVPAFMARLSADEPIGYVVFDLDYYSSTRRAIQLLVAQEADKYLPITLAYFDDIALEEHNSYCGELLAIREFNDENALRKLERYAFLENSRIYKKANWLKHMFFLHVLDHPKRRQASPNTARRVIPNPYLSFDGNREAA